MASTWDVVGLGENSVDYVYRLPMAPEPNAKLPISSHRLLLGGQVATTLATCATLGLRTTYVGSFGSDDNGARIREALAQRGVDTTHAVIRPTSNRHAVILVDERTGDRTVLWERDPALALNAYDVPQAVIAGARLLHVDDVDEEAAIAAAGVARAAGIPVTSDLDRVGTRTEALVAAVTIPIFAEQVPAALTGEGDVERALRKLRRTHTGLLCVTLGSRGAMLLDGDQLHHVPAPRVDAVDATGAGDVFRGGFIYALLRGDAAPDILRFANAAAALSCTRPGAMDSVPTLAEVETLATKGTTGC
ncbi:MAG TPA: PfkB family carbohydrate kinase [Vicinamibacterales bacterium]|nr:PfkB family carbohydrate kinase [Vicinamibacterales bacterium]